MIDKHDQVEVINAKEATCTEDGYTGDTVCKVCGQPVQQGSVIPALGHTAEVQGAKDATCTEEGYTGDSVCTRCGAVLQQGTAIPKLSHHYENGKCTVCGAVDPNYASNTDGSTSANSGANSNNTGKDNSPKTGDNSAVVLSITLLLVSAGAMAGMLAYSRKKNQSR